MTQRESRRGRFGNNKHAARFEDTINPDDHLRTVLHENDEALALSQAEPNKASGKLGRHPVNIGIG